MKKGKSCSVTFKILSIFIDDIYLIFQNLTRPFRVGDWDLHLTAVRKSLPLLFSFDHYNYARWVPLYFEDCLEISTKFPELFTHYKHDGFVARLSNRSASGLPFDHILEKVYNNPAKRSTGGIIGVTKRKECLLKYDLLKTLKEQYTEVLVDLADCGKDKMN